MIEMLCLNEQQVYGKLIASIRYMHNSFNYCSMHTSYGNVFLEMIFVPAFGIN